MFRFPWGDMHSLNLGWFLQKFNELRADWATAEENITGALDAEIQRAEDALSDVFDARDAAAASATAAAGSASSAGTSATAAQNSATGAANSATLANQKATAAGLSEAAAAQSATAASSSATAAAGSATQAGQSATNAAGSATAAGNSASAAAASKEAAETAAAGVVNENLISEGFAVGEQNGVPVTSGSPYYQNNAKYFGEQSNIAISAMYLRKYDADDTLLAGFIQADGIVGSSNLWKRTEYIPIPIYYGGQIAIKSTLYGNGGIAFYNSAKELLLGLSGNNASNYGYTANQRPQERIYTVPKNTVYVRASLYVEPSGITNEDLYVKGGVGIWDVLQFLTTGNRSGQYKEEIKEIEQEEVKDQNVNESATIENFN